MGDTWKPNPLTACRCTAPSLVECSLKVVPVYMCLDHNRYSREPGDQWLANPTTNCTCTNSGVVICQIILNEPLCIDISGNSRKNGETWMNSSCVYCSCINGSINCSGYDVKITYGLFSVQLFPTCEKCHIQSSALWNPYTCKGKLLFL